MSQIDADTQKKEEIQMIVNPLDVELKKANDALQNLYRRRDNLNKKRSWYQNTDPSVLASTIQSLEAKQKESENSRQGVIGQINGIQEEIMRLPIRSMFNLTNWFDTEQRNLRRQRKTFLKTERDLRQQLRDIDQRRGTISEDLRSNAGELQQYYAFERDDRELSTEIPKKEKEVNRIKKRKEIIDKAQKPIIAEIEKYDAEINNLEHEKRKAQGYESRLTRTRDKDERKKIHKMCETEFGIYSPAIVIEKRDSEIDWRRRGKQKTEDLLQSETHRLYTRDIREIAIDGNNLCYADEKFVGLVILDKLIPLLLQDYDVTLFFDSEICRQVKLNEQTLKKRYAPASVLITPRGHEADAAIVKYASDDEQVYVLTDDRFMDRREYSVFKEKRLMQPMIRKNKLIILDLDVDFRFDIATDL